MKFTALFLITATLATSAPVPPDSEDAAYPAIQRFVEVLETVRKRHPDVEKLAYERLVNHALEGMLNSLDPFSSFIHPEMAALMKESSAPDPVLPSLGITLGLRDDGPYISAVAPLGPAAAAGVLPDSALLQIDARPLTGFSFPQIIDQLHRPAGNTSTLLLKSPAEPQPVIVTLVHRFVETHSVTAATLFPDAKTTGYLRLATFGSSCASEVEAALDSLEDQGATSLILDLRQNGGGDLDQTVKILGLFLPPSTAVVTTRGRDGQIGEALKTPDRQRRKRDYPLIVLIDRMSASASELTAGALQDLKRATIIGELSYGKGSVQNIIPMGGGTALRLTIATYHTPSGNTPHHKGITPDLPLTISSVDAQNFLKQIQFDSLSTEEREKIMAWKDPVLQAAVGKLRSK